MAGFGNIKDLYKLQKEARAMQKKMKKLKISGLSKNERVEVVINGTQEVEEIHISDELMEIDKKKDLVKELKNAMKNAQKQLQKEMAKDMDMDSLKNMLG